ncbi:MAG: D-alanyl-D-alanine carboxypeptidase, partial [Chloroflexi bacterium]|nr:D-alanyl-D-alanine carboxypeptidase [Chloroflexota bacterium]
MFREARLRLLRPALALVCLGFGPPTLTSLDPFGPSLTAEALNTLAATAPALPVQASASIVVDADSGHALAATRADARLAQASLTKIMTALVAVERSDLNAAIHTTERSLTEPSVIGLGPGDTLPLEEMLYGLLLSSGNDAALAIAETVGGGSIERFVGWMNERATAMGLHNTRFANANGLDAQGHYSSARDVAETARALLAEPTLARIVNTPRRVVQGPPPYVFVNNNPLLGSYEGLDGVKTGFTDNAGRTFAASASRDGQRLIVVLLNSPDIRAEGRQLLDFGFRMQTATLNLWRPGFSRVISDPGTGVRETRLGGWELPFLRTFSLRDVD